MTEKLKTIAMRYMPNSVRIGLDVEVLDIDGREASYRGYEYATGEEHYDNAVLCIKLKHKWIEKPFWINVFKGAQRKDSDVVMVIATWEKHMLESDGTMYKMDGIDCTKLEEGSESMEELIVAFFDMWFEDGGIIEDAPGGLYSAVEKVEGENFIVADFKFQRKTISKKNIEQIEDLLAEAKAAYLMSSGMALRDILQVSASTPKFISALIEHNPGQPVVFSLIEEGDEWANSFSIGFGDCSSNTVIIMDRSEFYPVEEYDINNADDLVLRHNLSAQEATEVLEFIDALYLANISIIEKDYPCR